MDTMDDHFIALNGIWSPKIGLKQHPLTSSPTPCDVENKSSIYTPSKSHSLNQDYIEQSNSIKKGKSTAKSKRKALSPLPLSSSNIQQQQHTPDQLDSKSLMKVLSSPDETTFKSHMEGVADMSISHASVDVLDDSNALMKSLRLEDDDNDDTNKGDDDSSIFFNDSHIDLHLAPNTVSEDRIIKSDNIALSSEKYTIQFIPGNMGLDLEPVIKSSDTLVGCKVKDFYFGLDHNGITPEELLQRVKPGDVIDTVNGTCVVTLPFKNIINMLVNLKNTHRQIVFKRFATAADKDNIDINRKNSPQFGNASALTSSKSKLILSPKEVKRVSQAGPFSPGTYAHLTAFERACMTPQKEQDGDDSFEPPIVTIPKTIHKTLQKVVNVVGEKAVEAAKVFSGHETIIANKNALLSELSHCCVMLGDYFLCAQYIS